METYVTRLKQTTQELVLKIQTVAEKHAQSLWTQILATPPTEWLIKDTPGFQEKGIIFSGTQHPDERTLSHDWPVTELIKEAAATFSPSLKERIQLGTFRRNYLNFLMKKLWALAGSPDHKIKEKFSFRVTNDSSTKDTTQVFDDCVSTLTVSYTYFI